MREESAKNEDYLASLREPDNDSREDVFNLIPPRAPDRPTRFEFPEAEPPSEAPVETPAPVETARNVRAVGAMDLSRMSIDNDGRLYWDGKPVEVRRRMMMSRGADSRRGPHRALCLHRRDRRGRAGLGRGARLGLPDGLDQRLLHRARYGFDVAGTDRHPGLAVFHHTER